MSWENSFIEKAAREKLKEEGLLTDKEDEESKTPEGVTIEREGSVKGTSKRNQDVLHEGILKRE